MSNITTRTPEPHEPEVMPKGWPPEACPVGDHVRKWIGCYLLAGSLLTLAGIAWTILEVRALRQLRGAAERVHVDEETR